MSTSIPYLERAFVELPRVFPRSEAAAFRSPPVTSARATIWLWALASSGAFRAGASWARVAVADRIASSPAVVTPWSREASSASVLKASAPVFPVAARLAWSALTLFSCSAKGSRARRLTAAAATPRPAATPPTAIPRPFADRRAV